MFDKACLDGVKGLGGNRFRDILKTLLGRVDKALTGHYFYLKEEILEELGRLLLLQWTLSAAAAAEGSSGWRMLEACVR